MLEAWKAGPPLQEVQCEDLAEDPTRDAGRMGKGT